MCKTPLNAKDMLNSSEALRIIATASFADSSTCPRPVQRHLPNQPASGEEAFAAFPAAAHSGNRRRTKQTAEPAAVKAARAQRPAAAVRRILERPLAQQMLGCESGRNEDRAL